MIGDLQRYLGSYNWFEVVLEMGVIWVCVYLVFRFLRGTQGAGVIKGVTLVLAIVTLIFILVSQGDAFGRLKYIFERLVGLAAIILAIVFQPELRQAMIRLGHARIFRGSGGDVSRVVDAVTDAVDLLAKTKVGALIAIERSVKLGGLVEGGQRLDAEVSARLLQSIFWPNNPLHDLGVVLRGERIVAANVQFPLAEHDALPPNYGSRHRAAAGLTLESDCIVVIVSEETGTVSIAERGHLKAVSREHFREILAEHLEAEPEPTEPPEATRTDEPAVDDPEIALGTALASSLETGLDIPRLDVENGESSLTKQAGASDGAGRVAS